MYKIDIYFLEHKLTVELNEKGHNIYFPEHKLTLELDEKGLKDGDEHKENERENTIKEHLGCKFIRINPNEIDFNISVNISKITITSKKSSVFSIV